ncbi:MAG: HupE/UreJ family protein, partial [Gemmatimonadota bacterium]
MIGPLFRLCSRPHPRRAVVAALTAVTAVTVVPSAWAHTGTGQTAGLLSGLLHPVSGLDHV